jgi:hypothetical protein
MRATDAADRVIDRAIDRRVPRERRGGFAPHVRDLRFAERAARGMDVRELL